MKEIILLIALLSPKNDSICNAIEIEFLQEAKNRGIELIDKKIEYRLVELVDDTLAYSIDNSIFVEIGHFVSFADELGRYKTLIYHELAHIYLNRDDVSIGRSIMNYKYIEVNMNLPNTRDTFLNELFYDTKEAKSR